MAALGQLIAGIAHEINTPMGAIRSSVENLAGFFEENLSQLPAFFQTIPQEHQEDLIRLIQNYANINHIYSTREKRQFKKNIIAELEKQSIKNNDTLADTLVDLGIYSPEQILPFLPLLKSPLGETIVETAYQLTTLQTSTKTIKTAVDRATKIVFALRNYTRYEKTGELIQTNLIEGIEIILTLYHNQLKQGVEVVRNYQEIPLIYCYPDELNQVWTNLISNALHAMENRGTLAIDIQQKSQTIQVQITDTGAGIPPEIQAKIFQPFFTTKSPGEGTGLGLDIVKKIIEKHRGEITVNSEPNHTTFTVSLPIISKSYS
jgi:signal transduction histidine kinase